MYQYLLIDESCWKKSWLFLIFNTSQQPILNLEVALTFWLMASLSKLYFSQIWSSLHVQGVAIAFKCGATKAQFDSTVSTSVTILT